MPGRFAAMGRAVGFAVICSLVGMACAEQGESPPSEAPSDPADGLVFLRSSTPGGADLWLGRVSDGLVAPLHETPDVVEADPHWVSSMLRILYLARPAADPRGSRLMLIDPFSGVALSATENTDTRETIGSVSADGKRIAYSYVDELPGQLPKQGIRILDPLASKEEELGRVSGAEIYLSLAFSPGAGSVVAQIYRKGRAADLWLFANKKRLRNLVGDPRWNDVSPGFSYHGREVIFARSLYSGVSPPGDARSQAGPLGGGDICVVQLVSGQIDCPVSTTDAREFGAAPSPTAAEMVYVRERGEDIQLFLSDLTGQNERQLTHSADAKRFVVWSPDGKRMAFEAGPRDARRVRVIDREGNVLFDEPGFAPDWTPPLL